MESSRGSSTPKFRTPKEGLFKCPSGSQNAKIHLVATLLACTIAMSYSSLKDARVGNLYGPIEFTTIEVRFTDYGTPGDKQP